MAKTLFFPNQISININDRKFQVYAKRNYLFWRELNKGKWEPETFAIFDKFLDNQHSYIDIGAFIGATVLYGCQLAKHCYAVEPDPVAFDELKTNVELNKGLESRITLANLAISVVSGTILLHQALGEWGNSSANIVYDKTKSSLEVKSKTFQQFIFDNSINDCNFIKMDIEGGEFIILPTMIDYLKTNKPTLLIELHPKFVNDPISKLKDIENVLEIYDHICDEKFKEINFETILLSFKNSPDKELRIVLTTFFD